jgi:DNA invertase Pin-like site-specific DNA recombinase
VKKIRCAIYTRKSSEDGLEQEFNSLDAQREACTAYITSQKIEGWVLVSESYDDGGLSGGTLVLPILQRLMADIQSGKVDQIIVYKIDRLTRSLGDFSKIVAMSENRVVSGLFWYPNGMRGVAHNVWKEARSWMSNRSGGSARRSST